MSSNQVDDGTCKVNTPSVVGPVSGCKADSKSGRRDNASGTTLSRPGLYSTESCTPQIMTATSPSAARRVDCLQPCVKTHGPYRLQMVYLEGDRRENLLVSTSWQGVPCRALDNYAQLVAADAINNRRHALRRLHRTALTRSRLRSRWRHRPHGMVCLGLQSSRWAIASSLA